MYAIGSSKIYQADVKAAFFQAALGEKIFVMAPPGYDSVDPNTGDQMELELEFELIQTNMTQKPMLRVEVGACRFAQQTSTAKRQ